MESTATGAAQDFTLTEADGSALLLGGATVRPGSDAALDLGAGITATSSTNTFTDLVPGVTLTLAPETAIGAVGTVKVERAATQLSDAVSDIVTKMNALLAEIDKDTAYNSTSKVAGVLGGDSLARNLRSTVLGTVFPGDGTSLAAMGVNTTRDGSLVFDAAKFATAYAANPAGTADAFTSTSQGFADRVATAAKSLSDPRTGTITSAITGQQTGIKRLQDSIDGWDIRLASRRETLTRQFTALETALNQMQNQSSWLTSQLDSLSSLSSNS